MHSGTEWQRNIKKNDNIHPYCQQPPECQVQSNLIKKLVNVTFKIVTRKEITITFKKTKKTTPKRSLNTHHEIQCKQLACDKQTNQTELEQYPSDPTLRIRNMYLYAIYSVEVNGICLYSMDAKLATNNNKINNDFGVLLSRGERTNRHPWSFVSSHLTTTSYLLT